MRITTPDQSNRYGNARPRQHGRPSDDITDDVRALTVCVPCIPPFSSSVPPSFPFAWERKKGKTGREREQKFQAGTRTWKCIWDFFFCLWNKLFGFLLPAYLSAELILTCLSRNDRWRIKTLCVWIPYSLFCCIVNILFNSISQFLGKILVFHIWNLLVLNSCYFFFVVL